ncbi:CapA family protein [Enterococcus gilvus]|uniref:CapA family protein n=1 Tax=Enterococcus gilvus TaxID=160453 RepID=UPI00345E4894
MENYTIQSNRPTAITFTAAKIRSFRPENNRLSHWGTNHLLLYLQILRDLQNRKLASGQLLTYTKGAGIESHAPRSTNWVEGEKRSLSVTLNQAISFNAPDCIRALCQLYGGEKKTRKKIDQLARELNISMKSRISLTGRLAENQRTNFFDYYKIGLAFLKLNRSTFMYIRNRNHAIKEKNYTAQSILDLKGDTIASLFWGSNQNDCLMFHDCENVLTCSLVINGRNYSHTIEMALLDYSKDKVSPITQISLENKTINILADTYWGEFYSKIRKAQNREDALQKYGYHYSFDKIGKKMSKKEFNILTYEGVLIKPEQECNNKHKVFYLGGDKDETLFELKKRHINLVNLGNNHAKDYGEATLNETIKALRKNGLDTLGAGENITEALKPIILTFKTKTIALFSGYWYRREKDLAFDFYAGKRSGVSSLDGVLLDKIEEFKQQNPDTFVTVLSHWGADFKNILPQQTKLAKALISKGADLILGSGPHKIQPIDRIDGKLVFYSLGNGVFNSDGWDLSKSGNLPYGYFLKWELETNTINVYPFMNDNQKTFWQPYFFKKEESQEVRQAIEQLNKGYQDLPASNYDSEGHVYFNYPVEDSMNPQNEPMKDVNMLSFLKDSLPGYFLDDACLPSNDFDYISVTPNNIKRRKCEKAIYISLTNKDARELRFNQQADGNTEFMRRDIANQVALIITTTPIESYRGIIPQYIVKNTLLAATTVADAVVHEYKGKMITITGSVGKSSVRKMLEQVLKKTTIVTNNANSNCHRANLDLALNLFSDPDYAVAEVALGGLTSSAYGNESYRYRSDLVIITSFGSAHSEFNIQYNLNKKIELIRTAKENAAVLINADIKEKYLWKIVEEAHKQNLEVKTYSLTNDSCSCYLLDKEIHREYTILTIQLNDHVVKFDTQYTSEGQIQNIMGTLLALDTLNYDWETTVSQLYRNQNLSRNLERSEITYLGSPFTLIDDTNNNSPQSMQNGLKYFSEHHQLYSGTKIVILGEFAEVASSLKEHMKMEYLINQCHADKVLFHGELFKNLSSKIPNAKYFDDKAEISRYLKNYLMEDSLVYVKGSAAGKFYTVADEIKNLKEPFGD